ncbi:MAG: protein kinase, partial [Armatimonadetes bacterium]|nr:protein kinase [Armatimonadota bacterium]
MVGRTVCHYRIMEELGGGGMGVVYRAEDTRLKRIVALKFLSPQLTRDPAAKQRFIKEAQAASSLDHPNICTIHEIEETEDGQLFLSLACYEGETVRERLSRGPMPVEEVAGLAVQVARGLDAAHSRGIVHRDMKPANIFITNDGRAKILDFGLAMLAGQTRVTKAGSTVGTVAYMSPEQARGEELDSRTDIWSLGVVMYEVLTGKLPFQGDRPEAVLYSVVHETPRPVSELRSDVPPRLAALVMRCLEKNPSARWPSSREMVTSLEEQLGGSRSRYSEIRLRSTTTLANQRSPRRGLVVALSVVVVACVGFWSLPQSRSALQGWLSASELPEEKQVAVLPFASGNGSPDEGAMGCGFRHYLSFRLGQLEQYHPDFRLVPTGGVEDRPARTPGQARDAYGATIALAGRITRGTSSTQLVLDILDAASGRSLDTWQAEESPANVAAMQTDPVLGAAAGLGLTLDDRQRAALAAGGTTVPGAFELYLEGLGHLRSAETDSTRSLAEAMKLLEDSLELDASFALAASALGEACWQRYLAEGDTSFLPPARSASRRAVELGDRLSQPHLTLCSIWAKAGNYPAAVRELRRALDIDPLDFYARRKLADLSVETGDYTLAELTYGEAVDLRRNYWLPRFDIGLFYYGRGRYEDAIAALRTAAGLAPGNSYIWNALGAVYFQLDMLDQAKAAFERCSELEPSYAVFSNLGTLYFGEARYADACNMYAKALELEDERYTIWGNYGAACNVVPGRGEDATEAYRRAVELAERQVTLTPRDADLLAVLASYYAELDQADTAAVLVSKALRLAPDNIEVMFQAGHTYEVLGDRDAALTWIGRA